MPKQKISNSDKEKARKYERAKELAAARQRKYKAKKTEEQLERKREMDRKRMAEKRHLVKDMGQKEHNKAKKEWKRWKRDQRKRDKERQDMLLNTPPESEEGSMPNLDKNSRQSEVGKKIARRNRSKLLLEIKAKNDENKKLSKQLNKYKKRLAREKKKNQPKNVSPSPQKKLKEIVGREKVSPVIKKRLFAGLVLEKQLKQQVNAVSPKSKLRQQMVKVVGNDILKKYRLQSQYKMVVPYKYNKYLIPGKPKLSYDRGTYETQKIKEAQAIRRFYEDDMVSKMMPGKKDYVKRGHIKMQKRILVDSLYNLYDKFVEDTSITTVSRSIFYRCRPWWIYKPQKKDRETCACAKHENIAFLVTALKSNKVIKYGDIGNLLKDIVCSVRKEECMMGLCPRCNVKEINFDTGNDEEIKFYKWQTVTEVKNVKGITKPYKHVEKTTMMEKKSVVVNLFKKELVTFKKHVFFMIHQAKMLKSKTEMPGKDEIIFQVDFSQNYIAKYASEIQSMHFGASQKQISLHTGARYVLENTKPVCTTFCTVSDNIDHQAHGVWGHLNPVLQKASQDYPQTKSVIFFSDSPSSQYRNKTNVYFMKHFLPKWFPNLETFTWNFSEAGHGKGVMDGVGGSLKRNADVHIMHQKDITCAQDFVNLFINSKTKTSLVSSDAIKHVKTLIPSKLGQIEGIMSVRQITYSKLTGELHFRRLTCFECPPKLKCKHFHLFTLNSTGIKTNTKSTKPAKETKTRSNQKKTIGKKKLKVEDLYTSSSDNEEEFVKVKKDFGMADLNQETFVLVSFPLLGSKAIKYKNYVAIIQNENFNEREVFVMFMKSSNCDPALFFPDENDESYVSVDLISGILPKPKMIVNGDRISYRFTAPVPLKN